MFRYSLFQEAFSGFSLAPTNACSQRQHYFPHMILVKNHLCKMNVYHLHEQNNIEIHRAKHESTPKHRDTQSVDSDLNQNCLGMP